MNVKKLLLASLVAMSASPLLAQANEDVVTTSGEVRTCTARYSPGFFEPDYVMEGYCIGGSFNAVFVEYRDIVGPQYQEMLDALAENLGRRVQVTYEVRYNNVGCSLTSMARHPLQCSRVMPQRVLEILPLN